MMTCEVGGPKNRLVAESEAGAGIASVLLLNVQTWTGEPTCKRTDNRRVCCLIVRIVEGHCRHCQGICTLLWGCAVPVDAAGGVRGWCVGAGKVHC